MLPVPSSVADLCAPPPSLHPVLLPCAALRYFLPRCAVLCRELVASVAQDNVVVVTWANYHYRDFVMNWVEHLRATGCTAFIVGE